MKAALKRNAIRLMSLPPLARTMNRVLNRAPVIFTLHRRANPEHGIGGHDAAVLRKQLEFMLGNGYRAVTMDVIDAWVNGEDMDMTNTVAFTFDDGYRDQAELIRDVFLPLGVPASVFLITGFVDGRLWPWDARISWLVHHAKPAAKDLHLPATGLRTRCEPDLAARRQLVHQLISHLQHRAPDTLESAIRELAKSLDMEIPATPPECHAPLGWEETRALEKSGIRFGSHTQSHYIVSTLTLDQAQREILDAKQNLEAELAAPLTTFAYPIGTRRDYSGGELRVLADAGYTAAVTMTPGIVDRREPGNAYGSLSIHRFGMPDDLEDFVQYLSWIERLKEGIRAVSPRTWIDRRHGSREAMVESWQTNLDHRLGRLKVSSAVDWSKVRRLVFICQGNVCRSPFAEAVAREHGIPSVSFGLKTNPGTRVNPIASRIALELGVDMTEHTSQRFDPAQLRDGDLALGMEPVHLAQARADIGAKDVQWTLIGLHLRSGKVPYIADPYGTSDAYHRRCFGMIRAGVDRVSNAWLRHHPIRVGDTRRTNRAPALQLPGRADT
jgi:protein-tyrosine-phosphatase/peptidoglycan/xylan/chitin deacetylase (PgdA/CDA1 family)